MDLRMLRHRTCCVCFLVAIHITYSLARRNASLFSTDSSRRHRSTLLDSPFAMVNPLRDQPNLSVGRHLEHDVIHGSRRAFTVTKLEYLKKDWCKTERLRQVVREEGCLRTTILNRFCYGQCNSFYIPRSGKMDSETAAFTSCGFCRPKRTSTITVTLRCPNSVPKFRRKRIPIIKQCKCMAQSIESELLV